MVSGKAQLVCSSGHLLPCPAPLQDPPPTLRGDLGSSTTAHQERNGRKSLWCREVADVRTAVCRWKSHCLSGGNLVLGM